MCEIKRRAQARIYAETKDLTPEELVAHYHRIGTAARRFRPFWRYLQRRNLLEVTDEMEDLAAVYLRQGVVPPKYADDAICTVARDDYPSQISLSPGNWDDVGARCLIKMD